MPILTQLPHMLVHKEQSRMGSVLLSFIFKNKNESNSIKALYIVLCGGSESENKKTTFAVFADEKSAPEISGRWKHLHNGLFLYPAKEITADQWNFAVKYLDYRSLKDIIPCPILTTKDELLLTLVKRLDKTQELTADCRDMAIKLHHLLVSYKDENLFEPEDQIADKLKAAFG